MLTDGTNDAKPASNLATTINAVDGWLGRLHSAFDVWRLQHDTSEPADDLWQQVLQWHAAFDLSFTQLTQSLDDLTDVSDAQLALAQASESILSDGIRMHPLAHQRLRALSPELQDHLVKIHLTRLFVEPLLGAERIDGMDDLYRIRAHACRVVYHYAQQSPLILAVTAEHWRHPLAAGSDGAISA